MVQDKEFNLLQIVLLTVCVSFMMEEKKRTILEIGRQTARNTTHSAQTFNLVFHIIIMLFPHQVQHTHTHTP